jgi:hypothetical protein
MTLKVHCNRPPEMLVSLVSDVQGDRLLICRLSNQVLDLLRAQYRKHRDLHFVVHRDAVIVSQGLYFGPALRDRPAKYIIPLIFLGLVTANIDNKAFARVLGPNIMLSLDHASHPFPETVVVTVTKFLIVFASL